MTDFLSIQGEQFRRPGLEPRKSSSCSSDLTRTEHSSLPLFWSGGQPLLPPQTVSRRWHLASKRVLDIALALLAIVVFAPVMAGIAILIRRSDRGPVIFRQVRMGLHGRPFELLKFRTMRQVASAEEGESKITAVGAWLRRTSLDELPQVFNILRGEMSFCGPRPHIPEQLAAGRPYREIVPYYDLRHNVMPGLTGWAQANGFRGPTNDAGRARARIDHDLAYAQNASLWLDIKIIAITAKREFLSGNGS